MAWDLTLLQLAALGERHRARERAADRRAGEIVALLYNVNRDRTKDPHGKGWEDFFPQEDRAAMSEDAMLRAMLLWSRVTAVRG